MKHRIITALLGMLTVHVTYAQTDSYIGVYVHPRPVVTIEGEHVGFSPIPTMDFEVSLVNEEGSHEIYLTDGIAGSFDLELERNGRVVSRTRMAVEWSTDQTRFALDGTLPPEPSVTRPIGPRFGVSTTMSMRPPDDRDWIAGNYVVRLRLRPDAASLASGASWSGRGGLGEATFTLRDAISAEDQLRVRKLSAMDAMNAGDFVKAAAQWQAIVDLDVIDLDGWAGLGVANFHLGRHQEAADCLERVMPTEPGNAPRSTLPLLLAESYVHLGELEEAARVLRLIAIESEVAMMLEVIQARVDGNE